MSETTFTFDRKDVEAGSGLSLAAALTRAGHKTFRHTAKDNGRGIFCGIGVCQDCLVTVNGVPNKRACMTDAVPGLNVETQVAFAPLDEAKAEPATGKARTITPDILVIGGGAAGLSAAISARQADASVIVVDERRVPGGQYFKQCGDARPLDDQQKQGADLLAAARDSGAELLGGVEIWGAFDGPLFLAEKAGAAIIAKPKSTIVATGAYERPCMVPGWTLPGVMTTGAAQTLWRSYRTAPGQHIAVCGSGPLNVQVALELAKAGAHISIVAEAAPTPFVRPLSGLKMMLANPELAFRGLSMIGNLRSRGVPVRNATRLARIDAEEDRLRAHFRHSTGKTMSVLVDAVCMNQGFEPQNEILRLLGAKMDYEPAFGHLKCQRSDILETSIPGLFAVGDCAGLGGAPAAMAEGRIAGRAAAQRLGYPGIGGNVADQRELDRHRAFQAALWRLHDIAPTDPSRAPPETVICRCEEISLEQLADGLADAPGHAGTLKRATRVGMGRCQGRYCGPVAARLVAQATGKPLDDYSHFAPRIPIKPVSIAAILAAQEALDETG